jgi:ribosomal protein S18
MSGPKVINIEAIRRQQQRLCARRLRQLRYAIEAWRDCLELAGKLEHAVEKDAATRLERLQMLSESDLSTALRELPDQIQFFQGEEAAARGTMIEQARNKRERRQRLEESATMLLRELREIDDASVTVLQRTIELAGRANEEELTRLEASLQRTLADTAKVTQARRDAGREARLAELAATFKSAGSSPQAIREWLEANAGANNRQREQNDRLAALLAEVEAWDDGEGVAPFVDRARAISAEPAGDRRELLTDSLVLDLAEHRKKQRRNRELAGRLREALAILEPYQSASANEFRRRLEQALTSGTLVTADHVAAEVEAWCTEEARREDAKLRREAVLNALCALGYEVREGMAAAWAEDGRIVLKKPSETHYGVELLSPAGAAALQARVIAFEYPGRGVGNPQRDREVEESWCLEVAKMQRLMTDAGFDAAVRSAIPAGSVKLKVVPVASTSPRVATDRNERVRYLK